MFLGDLSSGGCVGVCVRSREARRWRDVSGEEQDGCSALPQEIKA